MYYTNDATKVPGKVDVCFDDLLEAHLAALRAAFRVGVDLVAEQLLVRRVAAFEPGTQRSAAAQQRQE